MCSHADDFDPLLVGLTIGLRPRKTGQQRGMYVDDLVFVTPDKVRRENLHEPREHDEINFVVVQHSERAVLRVGAVFPRNDEKRHAVALCHRLQIAAVGQEERRLGIEPARSCGRQQSFQTMRFARDQDGHPLASMRLREAEFDFHAERFGEPVEASTNGAGVELPRFPGGLDGHAELASRHLLFQRLNVSFLFEQVTGDAGDHAGFVPPNDRDRRELFHGLWL